MEVLPNSPRKNLKIQKSVNFFPAYPIGNSGDSKFDYNFRLSNLSQPLHYPVNSRSTIKLPKTYLPPLEHKSSSKELNLSLDCSQVDVSCFNRKPNIRKPKTIIQSSSEKLIRETKLTYLPKLEENHNFDINLRRYSNESTEVFTPTFRNISCQNSSTRDTSRNQVKNSKKTNESTVLYPVSQKKLLEKESQSRLSNLIGVLPQSKIVKKIKVLHHKFPKDMFVNGNLSNC